MDLSFSLEKARKIAFDFFGINAEVKRLPGYDDANFALTTYTGTKFILKIAKDADGLHMHQFQQAMLDHLQAANLPIDLPEYVNNIHGETECLLTSEENNSKHLVRLLRWVDGRIWAHVNPKTSALREGLGKKAGAIASALKNFDHPQAHWTSDWDLANAAWTEEHLGLFGDKDAATIAHFQKEYRTQLPVYDKLPKSVIHNDINDFNILVDHNLIDPEVTGIIDFGDAMHTQTINDLAILLAYAIMDVPDPLAAACDVIRGYHHACPLQASEIRCLYALVGMRLVTTVTKAAIRRASGETDPYYFVSEQPAWDVLRKWQEVHPELARYSFREACGWQAHPKHEQFSQWAAQKTIALSDLFPSEPKESIHRLDLSPSSTWLGTTQQNNDLARFEYEIDRLRATHPNCLVAGGYLEPRPLYTAASYDKEGNSGPESRTVHLGVDFWLPSGTPVHALFDAEVVTATNDAGYKEYGGLVILRHRENDLEFFTLHGHLSVASLDHISVGDRLKKGDRIGYLGTPEENGHWAPHLHFQVMLSMLGYEVDFPGVAYPDEAGIWRGICPDPNLLFKQEHLNPVALTSNNDILAFREDHLGRGLSISYQTPLHIVRGDGAFLIDPWGRSYLDTVNNVNHVGHQHHDVVMAGQRQMGVLNTNTRYLHEEIVHYAEALLAKLPEELSVLHFVNSGSEANELAIRMAKTVTGGNDMMAIEIGYHGNTNAVMEVSSYKFDGKGGQGKPGNTHILPLPDPFRGIHPGADSGPDYAIYAKDIVENLKSQGKDLAGFIGESIISCGGQIMPPKDYFKEVYRHVRAAGGVCIADEVQTGFGRVGSHYWAFELHDVVPDIVTMGKPAGNAHPLAIVACTREIAETFNTGMEFFNTFGGNPVSCAIGRTVMEVVDREGLQRNAQEVGGFLKSEFIRLQKEFRIIGDVRGTGLFLGFELVDSEKKPLAAHAAYLANRMRDLGILMSTDGPDYNVLKIKPPMVFTAENAKELIFRLNQVFAEDFMQSY